MNTLRGGGGVGETPNYRFGVVAKGLLWMVFYRKLFCTRSCVLVTVKYWCHCQLLKLYIVCFFGIFSPVT